MVNMKRAQGGMNAAFLVAIVAALIIVYIIFLPTSEREKLLNNQSSGGSTDSSILRVSPGVLGTAKGLESEKKLPNIFLVETTNAKELEAINPFIVKKSLFDERIKTATFELDDPQNTDNVILAFSAKKRQGILMIRLNDEIIFESEIASEIVSPIKLPKSKLQKSNTLEFLVSSPGFTFWRSNEYSLDNIKIIGDITDISRQESNNLFTITESEIGNIERGILKFIPYCGDVNGIGPLEVSINNKKLFSSVPICDEQYRQQIPQSMLSEGENTIVFKTTQGSYSVEQIAVSLEFKSPKLRTYYFELTKEQFDRIRTGSSDLLLTLKFVDDKKIKRLKFDVNGHIETVDTDKLVFTKSLNSKISEGNNFIRLEPFDELEVLELSIDLK